MPASTKSSSTSPTVQRHFRRQENTIPRPEFCDINNNHVGIDVNNLVSWQAELARTYDNDGGEGVFQELRLNSREPMKVWVDYDSQV
ncbi:L-type lectin-domain containing receptor kinase IV.1-like [Hordeum vulgare]|nr:L-type lectin-domain containing receptor kinase IV.1-like [Hordeum vulgare]